MAEHAAEIDESPQPSEAGSISRRTLQSIERSIHNLDLGLVGDAFELHELHDLLHEP
jgi:hypothetical protein